MEFTCYENARTNADDEKVAEDEFARFDKLIVYGRFEEHDNDDDNVGFVQHQEAQQLVQVPLTSGGSSIATDQCIWFRGELVMSRPVIIPQLLYASEHSDASLELSLIRSK